MEALAKKCIHDHRHPLVKVSLPPHKLFFAAKYDEEKAYIEEYQDKYLTVLQHQRVEKRCSRAQAVWLADKNVAKVIKVVKNLLKFFGYQNKDGIFLFPEEMLYLLETNRLEVTFVDTSLSVEKAYELTLKTPGVNLDIYKVYKKLAILGYKLMRFEQTKSKISHEINRNKIKRSLEDLECYELLKSKKIKMRNPDEVGENKLETNRSCDLQAETSISREAEYVSNIFDQLRENMPRDCTNEINSANPDYCVWSPTNILKAEPDFNLFICENNIINLKHFNSSSLNIYAICSNDVSFYKFCDIHLPYI